MHENHNCDSQTFAHYPENMRLNAEQTQEVERMIAVGGNKQRIKAGLLSSGANVQLKLIHNIQTKMRTEKQQLKGSGELQKLLEEFLQVPHARVDIIVNEENELIGNSTFNFKLLIFPILSPFLNPLVSVVTATSGR